MRHGRSPAALDTFNDIFMYMCFSKTPALSPTRRRPAVRRDGATARSSAKGSGMVVLKRLDDAERDGDRIYAVIQGGRDLQRRQGEARLRAERRGPGEGAAAGLRRRRA